MSRNGINDELPKLIRNLESAARTRSNKLISDGVTTANLKEFMIEWQAAQAIRTLQKRIRALQKARGWAVEDKS